MDDTMSATDENVNLSDSNLRKRHPWNSLVSDGIDLLADVDELDDEEEEDGVGCPLPSTPEDNQLLEAEVCKCSFIVAIIITTQVTHTSGLEIVVVTSKTRRKFTHIMYFVAFDNLYAGWRAPLSYVHASILSHRMIFYKFYFILFSQTDDWST